MRFEESHAGKWVATKSRKVIDSEKSLIALMKRVEKRKDRSKVRFALIPKRCIAGILNGI